MTRIAPFARSAMGVLVMSFSIFAQTPTARPPAQPRKPPVSSSKLVRDGETVFRNNCHRCHTAPEALSPRITGTVLRHMRVRANLSAEDERRLLEYLAP